jgi:two-component system invasion response regulator UvrY
MINSRSMLRIIIADDHAMLRKGVIQILSDAFLSAVIEEAEDAQTLLKQLKSGQWDMAISDISMPGKNGLEILKDIRKIYPALPVLLLSMHTEDEYAIRALKNGASGYLAKSEAGSQLVNAVNKILSGEKYISLSDKDEPAGGQTGPVE